MEYLTERSEGTPCIVKNCPWFNIKYEQNCQAEFNGEPHVESCVDYAPGNQVAIGDVMDAEKAFWQYWENRWPFTSSNEKVLSLSANFRNTKEAFLAGWEANDNA